MKLPEMYETAISLNPKLYTASRYNKLMEEGYEFSLDQIKTLVKAYDVYYFKQRICRFVKFDLNDRDTIEYVGTVFAASMVSITRYQKITQKFFNRWLSLDHVQKHEHNHADGMIMSNLLKYQDLSFIDVTAYIDKFVQAYGICKTSARAYYVVAGAYQKNKIIPRPLIKNVTVNLISGKKNDDNDEEVQNTTKEKPLNIDPELAKYYTMLNKFEEGDFRKDEVTAFINSFTPLTADETKVLASVLDDEMLIDNYYSFSRDALWKYHKFSEQNIVNILNESLPVNWYNILLYQSVSDSFLSAHRGEIDWGAITGLNSGLALEMLTRIRDYNTKHCILVNLTPHPISVYDAEGNVMETISNTVPEARVEYSYQQMGYINNYRVRKIVYGDTYNLPDEQDGVVYIVSRIVVAQNPTRKDLVYPDTLVRNSKGITVGCKGFAIL